jgi:hypothetical protein
MAICLMLADIGLMTTHSNHLHACAEKVKAGCCLSVRIIVRIQLKEGMLLYASIHSLLSPSQATVSFSSSRTIFPFLLRILFTPN